MPNYEPVVVPSVPPDSSPPNDEPVEQNAFQPRSRSRSHDRTGNAVSSSDPSTIAYPDDTTLPNESSAAAADVSGQATASGDSAETIEYPADGAPPPADDGLPPPILPIADSAAPADVTQNAQASLRGHVIRRVKRPL